MSVFLVLVMYAVWSSCFAIGKVALSVSPPLFLTASRMLLASFLLVGFLALRNRASLKISLKQLVLISLLAFFGIYLTNALEFWSLQYLSAGKTCFIYSLCPFFSAFFSYLHFGEKMNRRKWLGLCIGVGGVLPVLLSHKGEGALLPTLSWPEIAMLIAAIATVYGWILMRLLLTDKGTKISPLAINGLAMAIGGTFALLHSSFQESWTPLPVASDGIGTFGISLLCMTFISNILCFNLYGAMLKKFTATFLSFMGLLSPIFASFSGWFLLGEPLSPAIFLSTGIVSIGAYLVHSAELKQGYIRKDSPVAET